MYDALVLVENNNNLTVFEFNMHLKKISQIPIDIFNHSF